MVVVASVVVEGVDAVSRWRCCRVAAVGGAGDGVGEGVAGGAVGVGTAGDAEGAGVVGDAHVDGGVLTVGAGPCHSWRRLPWALFAGVLALAPLVSLMPMVSYRPLSPWWLSLTLRVAVAEVAPSVVLSVMPVVRSLRALLWFTASLMLLMLLVVGMGLCVGGQWPVFGAGRWLVPSGFVWEGVQ